MKAIDRFLKFNKKIYNSQDILKNHIFDKYPIHYTDNTEDLLQAELYSEQSDYVWLIDNSIELNRSFPLWLKVKNNQNQLYVFPYVYKKSKKVKSWKKVQLVPTRISDPKTVQMPHICGEYDAYNGKDMFDIFFIGNKNTGTWNKLINRFSHAVAVKTYQEAVSTSHTDLFWIVWDDLEVDKNFNFDFEPNEWSLTYPHVFANKTIDQYNGISLMPRSYIPTSKEISYRFYAKKKCVRIIASIPLPYQKFKLKTYDQYLNALKNSKTEMFWHIPDDVIVDKKFNFKEAYQTNINHVFLNGTTYDGVVLFSKNSPIDEKEFNTRFIVNKKEHNIVASNPCPYEFFSVNSYSDYLDAKNKSKTEMFWAVPDDVILTHNLDLYFDYHNQYDRNITHVFLNNDMFDGIALHSKNLQLSQKEVETRFYINKKEWNIVYSTPVEFEQFDIDTYDEYLTAMSTSKTEMFWSVPSDVEIDKKFKFDLYFDHSNEYDRKTNHVMLNASHRDGIVLFSKHSPVSKKEVETRFYINKKEWNIVASNPMPYDQFVIDNYDDYEFARRTSKTEMFWMIPPEVTVADDFKFDLYFDHYNLYDRGINHVFKNGKAYDGISLLSTKSNLTKKEIDMRFFTDKKTYETVASNPAPYDIVFISKDEKHANENFKILTTRFPNAKRVSNVVGIHQAHIAAAKLCSTDMFWVVDGDAEIIDNFHFDYYVPRYDPDSKKTVHVWKAMNPINNLIYGYGAVKLLPKQLTLDMDTTKPDMTTSISPLFKSINRVSNITKFNTDEFSTWRSAFRECVKLSSKTINGQLDEETEFRLNAWCTRGKDKLFGDYCIAGAKAGKLYGEANAADTEKLSMINDFVWLEQQFKKSI